MATMMEDNDENTHGDSHSESDGSIAIMFDTLGTEDETQHDLESDGEMEGETPVNSPTLVSRFPRMRRASCPSLMARDMEHCRYLMAGSRTLPEPAVSRAYQSLLSHRDPILLERESRSKRLLSYYDYVPSRKVFNEQDQFVKDQNREELKIDLMIEERRKQLEAVAMEKELMGDDYKETEGGVEKPAMVDEEEFREIMMRRRLRRLQVNDSAYQGYFPQMDLYDFNQNEKERQKQAHVNSVRGKGKMQRRASELHLRKIGSHGMPTNQNVANFEKRSSRKESLGDELSRRSSTDHSRKLERTSTQGRINALGSGANHGIARRNTATGLSDDKLVAKEMKLQVLNAMKPLPALRRTSTGITPQNVKQP